MSSMTTKMLGAAIGSLILLGLGIAMSTAASAQQITDCVTCF